MNDDNVIDLFTAGMAQLDTRHPQASPEEAYRVYVSTGARSLRRTADLLGIPDGTVRSWSHRYQWRQRIRDTDLEITEGIADAAMAAVVSQQLRNVGYLSGVRDDDEADHKDRLRATGMLMAEFAQISAAVAERAGRDEEVAFADEEMAELAKTPEGVAAMLAKHRLRLGHG